MAGDGGRVPDVSEQRAEVDRLANDLAGDWRERAERAEADVTMWKTRLVEETARLRELLRAARASDPASVLAALLAESPEATVSAIEALLTSDEAGEVAARAPQGRYLGQDDWRTFADEARTAVAAACRSLLSKAPKEDG
jgi:hypothetical protein